MIVAFASCQFMTSGLVVFLMPVVLFGTTLVLVVREMNISLPLPKRIMMSSLTPTPPCLPVNSNKARLASWSSPWQNLCCQPNQVLEQEKRMMELQA